MRSTKANIGSLSSMANKVRQEKKNSASTKAKAPLARARARESKKPFKSADTVDESSSDSDSSSNGGSGSDSDSDLDAARAKFLASKTAKQNNKEAAEPRVNGAKSAATPTKPIAKGHPPTSAQKPADESASDSGSESESESDTSDSGGARSTANPVTSQQKSSASKTKRESSSESTSSSGSSSDSDDISKKNNAVNNSKAPAREESEESDSSSDDEEMPDAGAQTNVKGPARGAVVDAQGSSSEESDSGSESDDEGDGGKMAVARTNGKDATKESASQVSRTQWLNNSDFMLRKASSDNPGKEVADFFSNANLEGKQVWYFTAPASLPITVLKDMEIDLSKATNGGPLLTHNGDNYGLDLESYATNTQIQLLIPSSGGDKYTSLNHGIDSTVHLRRMAKFGPGGEVHATATDNYVPAPRPIREQPEGLRVRYTPIGVPTPTVSSTAPTKSTSTYAPSSQTKKKTRVQSSSSSESESESDSDVEMTTPSASITPASQTNPVKSSVTNGDRKRKHTGNEDQSTKRLKAEQSTEVPSVKQTPAQASKLGATSNATPSKKSSSKSKDKKEKVKKEKTPKSAAMTPTTAKQTPIPLPTYPGMKH
ncbi:DNA-directed RNA polymerase I subunit RPA34.5-domain-containing protein [Xylaria longipes]|nr:DNA-directed RNA polymerase I subunit RPA34.5-domain-containing protein [Xylaria longipes]